MRGQCLGLSMTTKSLGSSLASRRSLDDPFESYGPVVSSRNGDHSTPFEGFRWREARQLNLNFVWVLLYITRAPIGHASKVWFDNIVVARQYIGPCVISDGNHG